MRTILLGVVTAVGLYGQADAGCVRWDYIAGQLVCTQSQTAQCIRWGQVGGAWVCIQSQ